ncbi:MAG: hypothetical protein HY646_15835 [Acidobacteria bacterium]|nr:hypothetical protein [Acidobacteriota bacterium]
MDIERSNIDRLLKARAEIDEQIRSHKTGLVVLFTDIVGSTAYFDRYGDTAGVVMLHRHAELVSDTVRELKGRVIKTIGDSVAAAAASPLLLSHRMGLGLSLIFCAAMAYLPFSQNTLVQNVYRD